MKQEDKELLLKDLSARLPYGVKGLHRGQVHELFTIDSREVNNACIQVDGYDAWFSVDTFKPYLRPMSSMTEEEKKELLTIIGKETELVCEQLTNNNCGIKEGKYHFNNFLELDFLLSHHFDYRGLIEKGLALEVPKDMYK